MLRGSSPIQLSQLDISPAIQAGALEAQAAVNLASSVNQAIKDFTDKQEEKKQKKMTIAALEELVPGMSKEFYTAAAGNKDLQSSLIDAKEAERKAEDQRLTQGAYYLSQLPEEMRVEAAKVLGLPLPEEPEVLPFDIEGFELRISENDNKKKLLDQTKEDPDDPNATLALEKLGVPSENIPQYLESLKRARTAELSKVDEDVEPEPQEVTRTPRGRLIKTTEEEPEIEFVRGPRGRMVATNIEPNFIKTPTFVRPSDKRN